MPQGLIKETHSKALEKLVKQGVESYIEDLKKKPSNRYKDFKPIKPSPIVSGGSLHHYKQPNLGKFAQTLTSLEGYSMNSSINCLCFFLLRVHAIVMICIHICTSAGFI